MAAPVYLPPDPEIGDEGIAALPERHEVFAKNTKYLLRELKVGGAFAANAAYAGVGVVIIAFLALYAVCAVKVTPGEDELAATTAGPAVRPGSPESERDADRYSVGERQIVGASWGSRWGDTPTDS